MARKKQIKWKNEIITFIYDDDKEELIDSLKLNILKVKNKFYIRHYVSKKERKFLSHILLNIDDDKRIKFKDKNTLNLTIENLEIIKKLPIKKRNAEYFRQYNKIYYKTEKGIESRKINNKKYVTSHKSGYATLKRMANKKNKLLEISFEKYEELKKLGCKECGKILSGRGAGLKLINNKEDYKESNIIPCCGACFLKTSVKDFNYIDHTLKLLRRSWKKNPNARMAIQLAKQLDGSIKCAKCSNNFKEKEINIDHIKPVISLEKGFETIDEYVRRLYCSYNNLQILCKEKCHKEKTKIEVAIRKKQGSIKKTKINKKLILEKK